MRKLQLGALLAGASFFLAGCDYTVTPEAVELPQESPARALGSAELPTYPRVTRLGLGVVELSGSGFVELPPSAFCDSAQVVLGDALRVPFSCSGGGVISLLHRSEDPHSLLELYLATVQRIGGTAVVRGNALIVQGPGEGEATGVLGPLPEGLGAEPVGGLDGFTLSGAVELGEVAQLASYERSGLVRPVRDGTDRGNVESLVRELGLDLRVVELAGRAYVVGDELSLSTFDAFSGLGQEAVVPVASAGLPPAAVAAYQAAHPGVAFNVDDGSGMVFLSGLPSDVAVAVGAIRQTQPATSRVRVEGLFVSYETSDLRSLQAELNVSAGVYGLGPDAVGVSNGATLGLPFELVVDQVERSDFVQVVARPAVTATFGLPAVFRSGASVPVIGGSDPETGAETVEYRDTGLTARFTASPLLGELVRLQLDIELSSVAGSGVRDNPSFDVRSVSTTVDLRRGDTVLLSGLAEMQRSSARGRSFGLPSSAGSRADRSLGLFVTLR